MSMSKTYTRIDRYCKGVTTTCLHIGHAQLPAIRTWPRANTQAHSGVVIPNRRDEKMIYRSWPRRPAFTICCLLAHAAAVSASAGK